MLSIVGAIELDTLGVAPGASVVSSDNKVSGTMVLTDNSVPDGLTGPSHAHSKWEKTKDCHAIGISGEESLVDTYTGEVINVARFGETHNGVDKNVCLACPGSTDSELSVGSVHGIPGLESNNLGPSQLLKVQSQFGGSVYVTISASQCRANSDH